MHWPLATYKKEIYEDSAKILSLSFYYFIQKFNTWHEKTDICFYNYNKISKF